MKGASTVMFALAFALGAPGCALIDAIGGDSSAPPNDAVVNGDDGGGDGRTGDGGSDGGIAYEEPRLWAVHPAIVQSGMPVRLEGQFLPGTTVWLENDPVYWSANVLGLGRAEVDTSGIPSFTGNFWIEIDSQVSKKASLRVTPFQLGLSRIQDHYSQSNGARSMSLLDAPRAGLTAHVLGRYVYVFGGDDRAEVARARINVDGTLGRFESGGGAGTLQQGRSRHMSVRLGDWFYVLGGANAGTPLAAVEQTSIDENGEPQSEFSSYFHSLTQARAGAALAVVGTHVYVIGGYAPDPGAPLATIERAQVARGGELDPFEAVMTTQLVTARSGHTVEVIGDYLYVIGGSGSGGALVSVERALISPNGELGPFAPYQNLTTPREKHASLVLPPYLYVIGGTGGEDLDSIEITEIFEFGDIGTFSPLPFALPAPRSGASAVVAGNDLYLIGGRISSSATATDTIAHGPTIAQGHLASATTEGSYGLVNARSGAAIAADWTEAYVFGGREAEGNDHVEHAEVFADGTLKSNFAEAGQWDSPRTGACSAVLGDKIYFAGGETPAGAASSYVDWANFAGNFATPLSDTTRSLTEARKDTACVALGGYLYVIGGRNSSALGSVERAPFAANGDLSGDFTPVAGVTLQGARSGHSVAVFGDKVYVFGGSANDGSTLDTIEVATIGSDGSLSTFGTHDPLSSHRTHAAAVVVGSFLYMIGGANAGAEIATIERIAIGGNGELSDRMVVPASLALAAEASAGILMGNMVWILGGTTTGGTTAIPTAQTLQVTLSAPRAMAR